MNLSEIRENVALMADGVYEILDLVQKGFMEHKTDILANAIEKEHKLNESEKNLTKNILELSKKSKDVKVLIAIEQMVETLERMGDEATNLIERIEIKIAEKLLFSEEGVVEFNETYDTMKKSVNMMIEALKKQNPALRDRIIDNGFKVKSLVERYRQAHAERLVKGLCTPMGANMYFDMLDFTGNLARHASNIVKLI